MAAFPLSLSQDSATNPAGLVDVLLTCTPTAMLLLRPVYNARGKEITDFNLVQLNAAAQQLLRLPERPQASLLTLFPAIASGAFVFYRNAFLAGQIACCSDCFQHDGLMGYSVWAAQRYEQLLVVSLTYAGSQPHSAAAPTPSNEDKRPALLAVQQSLLQQLLRQVPAAVATLSGPEHHYVSFNDRYQVLSAHRAEVGQRVAHVMPELVAQGFIDLLDQVYATGQPFTGTDHSVQLFDYTTGQSEQRYIDFTYQPLTDEQGKTHGILAFLVDTTERVLARQQVEAANRELASINTRLTRTNVDLDTFVYSASHDLRAPIANIEGLLSALRQELPVEAWQAELVPRLLGLMDGAVARFQQTLGYLTEVTRIQPEALKHATELVELSALVEAVRLDILPELTAARATLTVDLAECSQLLASPKLLRSIFYNFLSNAIKYRSPERPPLIHLRSRRTAPGYLALEVQDNGLGLSEQQQKALFQLFKRLHSHVPGSGVGLYMVKKMVDNVGGTLTVQSQLGVGSTFTVTLPLAGPLA
ncbi:hypothetical protein FNT36_16505 [Hymenobacter setariae]|uniref:histidine kinase n=1 Tax=Hymenobacter setariae TaxID=2594794 RepID=A0A558BRW9_9BACT|nr:PAS domain-containing sensor histidine kinase [Hymenobacter setariae]TVT39258.1 hypothetical protein FNT36_16505 [Hymenobacter setariae]